MKRWFDAARTRLHLLVAGRAVESRMNEEFAFHIEMETDRLVRVEGVAPDEARRRALASFGGVTRHKEELREGRGLAWLGTLSLDARLAMRMLRKSPGLTAVAVVGMSVAIAIGSVCFSAVSRVLDARLPVSEGDRVIGLRNVDPRAAADARRTHLHVLPVWRRSMPALSDIGAFRHRARTIVTVNDWSESARVAEMTASGFRIARVAPIRGRYLVDADERPDATPVAVIGYRLWQQRYAARPDIVGQTIQVGDVRHTIVGVMPDGFAFPVNNRVWIPLRLNPVEYAAASAPAIEVFARLAPGATIDDARAQATLVGRQLAAADSASYGHLRQQVIPYTHMFIDNADSAWMYQLVQVVVLMLLAVIGTNVAVLVYARTASRVGEIAIRTSLGASRTRIVGQLFAEGLALSLIAAAAGVVIAWATMMQIEAAIQRIMGEQLPYWMHLRMTPSVVLYAVGLAILGAVMIGAIPALKVTSGRVRASLQELSAGGSGLRLGRAWTVMIVAQVAIAVAMLPVAIAGIGAWRRANAAQAVVAAKQVLTSNVSFDAPEVGRVDTAELNVRRASLRAALIRRLEADPRVSRVLLASNAPGEELNVRVEGEPGTAVAPVESRFYVGETRVQTEYFRAIGIPLLAGRDFGSADLTSSATSVIVNRSFMKRMYGGRLAVGSRVRYVAANDRAADTARAAPWQTIVGVVADFPIDSGKTAPRIYRPLATDAPGGVMFAVMMNGGVDPVSFIPALRQATLATSPLLRLDDIRTLSQAVYDASSPERLAVLVLELVTLSTILLSAAGIYALMQFTVTRRRREIGIRAALGAAPRRLLAGEMTRVMSRIAIGIVVGVAVAGMIDHALNGGWTGRRGVAGLVMVAGLMVVIGLLAALRPAIGALRIQPTEALRSE